VVIGIVVALSRGQEAMTMKTNSMILALVSSLSFAATGAGTAHAQEASAPKRGAIAVQAQAAKAVVAGPVAIHAYSAFSGATLFVVHAVTGTDRDCAGARAAVGASLAADHVQTLTVGAGEIACVATTAERGSELLWHVQKDAAAPSEMVASRN
jgi:hypothetical protein